MTLLHLHVVKRNFIFNITKTNQTHLEHINDIKQLSKKVQEAVLHSEQK